MKKPFNFYLAHGAGKIFYALLRLFKQNRSRLPAKLALKLDPHYLKHITKPELVIGISGSSAKSACSKLIGEQLRASGRSLIQNDFDDNKTAGLVKTFLKQASFGGTCKEDAALLEIDELDSLKLLPDLCPDFMLITTLFRDSCQDNAHPGYIRNIFNMGLPDGTKLVLNADDLISSTVKEQNPRVYYSMPRLQGEADRSDARILDRLSCPRCLMPLVPDFIRRYHLGHYHCPRCGFRSPEAKYQVLEADFHRNLARLTDGESEGVFELGTGDIFTLYACLASYALLREIGFTTDLLAAQSFRIEGIKPLTESYETAHKKLLTIPVKAQSSSATSKALAYLSEEEGRKAVVLANSEVKPGVKNCENTAWLYDNDFSPLNGDDIVQVLCVGRRCLDFAVRVLLAGVPEEKISVEEDFSHLADAVKLHEADIVAVVKTADTAPAVEDGLAKLRKKLAEGAL